MPLSDFHSAVRIAVHALAIAVTPLAGQTLAVADAPRGSPAHPQDLELRAERLQRSGARYRDAARLYLRAADERDPADARAVENRRVAANLFYHLGDAGNAQVAMESAAEAALAMGDIAAAAHRFIDAAIIARKRGMHANVLQLVARARLLTASPLLDEAARAGVRSRIRPARGDVRRTRIRLKTGIELDVAQSGSANGTPVLLLHGITDSWYSFARLLDRLPADIHAIVPTQRGHGDSDRPACCYGTADFAADAVALLDELGIDRAVVVGHSMGSFVAQRLAIDYPGRVDRLVLIGSGDTPRTRATAELEGVAATLADSIDPAFVRAFQESTVALPIPADFLDGVVEESLKVPARVWRAALDGMLSGGAASELDRIRMRTLLVSGDLDAIWGPDRQRALAHALPNARLLQYAGVGHAPHWEDPDRLSADLLAFIAN